MQQLETEIWGPTGGPPTELVEAWVMAQRAGEIAFQLGEIARAELIHKSPVLTTRIYEA